MVITPLNALFGQAVEISGLGVRAASVNAETRQAAANDNRNLLAEIEDCQWPPSIWSPERLIDPATDRILRHPSFRM
ncbi:hypothetical protein DFH29DRAFT_892340, partial [Suillus ampliporus]